MSPTSSSEVLAADLGPTAIGGFTTRHGGVSSAPYASLNLGAGVRDDDTSVRSNRRIVAEYLGAPLAFLTQVHSHAVLDVVAAPHLDELTVGEGDAAVTARADVGLAVLVADCVPILLAGDGLVAVAHAGRQGVLAGVVPSVLAAMAERGVPATHASIGPSICGACYEVPPPMQADLAGRIPAAASTTSWGTTALNLPAAVGQQLREGGVAHIEHHAICTREDDRFYSYRRDGVTGRFAGVIRRRHAAAAFEKGR